MNKKTILGIIAAVPIVGILAGDNFGFTLITGAESIGYNAWALLVYIGGGWLIYTRVTQFSLNYGQNTITLGASFSSTA